MDIWVDFFHVEPVDDKSLGEALGKVSSLSQDKRTTEVAGRYYRLSRLKADGTDGWSGDFVRVRMNNLPSIANLDSDDLQDIPLADDQGIGECASFYFHSETNVISLQRNRLCIGQSLVSPILRSLSGVDKAWSLLPLMRQDALKKIIGASEITEVLVEFATVKNPQLTIQNGDGNSMAVELAKTGVVPSLKIEMRSKVRGRSDGTNITKSAKDIAAKLWKAATSKTAPDFDVEKLEFFGTDENGDVLDIRMFSYQLSHSFALASQAEKRKIPYSTRKKFARDAFTSNEKQIRKLVESHG